MRLRAIHIKDKWWRTADLEARRTLQSWAMAQLGLCAMVDYYPESPWAGFTIYRPPVES